jgi:hypothetical protein
MEQSPELNFLSLAQFRFGGPHTIDHRLDYCRRETGWK